MTKTCAYCFSPWETHTRKDGSDDGCCVHCGSWEYIDTAKITLSADGKEYLVLDGGGLSVVPVDAVKYVSPQNITDAIMRFGASTKRFSDSMNEIGAVVSASAASLANFYRAMENYE